MARNLSLLVRGSVGFLSLGQILLGVFQKAGLGALAAEAVSFAVFRLPGDYARCLNG